jgi:hypothetical protein
LDSGWSGTGTVTGELNDEKIILESGQYMESETWYLGIGSGCINTNVYYSGEGVVIIEFKTGATEVACEASDWQLYNGVSFDSLGYIKIKISRS